MKAVKIILGVVAGWIVWAVLFNASVFGFAALWPEFQAAGRHALDTMDYSQLTNPMLILLLGMYFWVNPATGWLTMVIAKHKIAVWIVGISLFIYFACMHFYVLWNNLPNWYNLVVPLLVLPLVYFGSWLAKRH